MSYIFHVHTYRCGHASNEDEKQYIDRAVELGAGCIIFTDHAPFPHDIFTGRMRFSELQGYISTLRKLKNEYSGLIDIRIGLEIEYMRSFAEYYKELYYNPDIDTLVLGQHHCELAQGFYSYQLDDTTHEWEYLLISMIEAVQTGFFDVIAHPDRVFRHINKWDNSMAALSQELIADTIKRKIYLEKNFKTKVIPEFWQLVPPEARVIYGCDAHSVNELKCNIPL